MITPSLRGRHEVTQPVFIAVAEVGDGVIIHIWDIYVTSVTTASGQHNSPDNFGSDSPFVAGRCHIRDTAWIADDFAHCTAIKLSTKMIKLDQKGNKGKRYVCLLKSNHLSRFYHSKDVPDWIQLILSICL